MERLKKKICYANDRKHKIIWEGGCSFAVSIDELPLIQSALNLTNHFIDWTLHDKLKAVNHPTNFGGLQ